MMTLPMIRPRLCIIFALLAAPVGGETLKRDHPPPFGLSLSKPVLSACCKQAVEGPTPSLKKTPFDRLRANGRTTDPDLTHEALSEPYSARFGLCHDGGGSNCVVDGDTFWFAGRKIRIADIDTPETHGPRCPAEGALGARATERLRALLNAGSFSLRNVERNTDRYGRALRLVMRGERSIGGMLVAEGLARPWNGARQPWCRS